MAYFLAFAAPSSRSLTFEMWSGPSRSMIAPLGFSWLFLVCFLMMRTPSIRTWDFFGSTARILPVAPLWLPLITWTVSPFLTWKFGRLAMSENLRSERNDLHEVLFAEFTGDRTEDTGALGIVVLVDNHDRVVIEAEITAVFPPDRVFGANHDGADDFTLFDRSAGLGLADVGGDHVTDVSFERRLSDHANHLGHAGTGVVGYVES